MSEIPTNIKNHRGLTLLYQGVPQYKAIIEIIRTHNTMQEEYRITYRKYNNKIASLDLVLRATIHTGVMNRVIKFCY